MARLDVMETFDGIMFPGHLHTQGSLQAAVSFPFQDTDVLIASYPKSGTTWLQEIVTLIHNKGDPQFSQSIPNWTRTPWLEQYYCAPLLQASPTFSPRIFTTHLPHHLLGPALHKHKPKVIYVSRNPKDVLVSYYHFHKMANFLPEAGTFQHFFSNFLEGKMCYGSWFDHFKGWSSQTMNNLLHITYEEMSQNIRGAIKRISCFLQRPLLEEEISSVMKHCSFSSMKDNNMVNYTLVPAEIMDHSRGSFMRKGKTGDWKTMFTEEQDQHFKLVYRSWMHDCPAKCVWAEQDEDEEECV